MSWLGDVASIFLPNYRPPAPRSIFEGEEQQTRKERPLLTYSQTRWFQDDVESAIHMADTGKLLRAAQLARAIRRDGIAGGILSTRTGGLTRLPKMFRGTPAVVSALQNNDQPGLFDRVFSSKELALLDGDGVVLGVGVGELVPIPGRREPIFVRLDPEGLEYRWSDERWYYRSYGGLIPITPGDGRWILHMPGGLQAPWANGLWPALGRAYVAKDHAFEQRENYSGKLANPARIAQSPNGATADQMNDWFQKVAAWGINTVFALKPGYEVKLLESNGVGYQVFQSTIDTADKEFMICLAGQIVTITGGAGFANADIHATIRSDLIQDDGDALAQTINEQGLRPLVNAMFGCGARGAVQWDTTPPANRKAEAEAISAAAKAISEANTALQPYGLRVDAVEVATRFKVPTKSLTPEVATGADGAPVVANDTTADSGDPPSDDAAAQLAAKMTEHAVPRCEHGSSNRCRLCGVERVRDFTPGADGCDHTWSIAWRPIPAEAPRKLALVAGGGGT